MPEARAIYRKLCVPKDTAEQANQDLNEFFMELAALREKYGLPDVLCVVAVNVNYGDGQEGEAVTYMNYGQRAKVESLAAYAYGRAQAESRAIINQLFKGNTAD